MEHVLSTEQQGTWTAGILGEIRVRTTRMADLAREEAWEDLVTVVRERHDLIDRCLGMECAPTEKRELLAALHSLLRDDAALIERCIKERDAARDGLAAMARAKKASIGYRLS